MLSANPNVEEPEEEKIKKKLESSTLITIKKGKATPRNNRVKPNVIRKRASNLMADITNKQQNDRAQVQNLAVLLNCTLQALPLNNAGESDTQKAG